MTVAGFVRLDWRQILKDVVEPRHVDVETLAIRWRVPTAVFAFWDRENVVIVCVSPHQAVSGTSKRFHYDWLSCCTDSLPSKLTAQIWLACPALQWIFHQLCNFPTSLISFFGNLLSCLLATSNLLVGETPDFSLESFSCNASSILLFQISRRWVPRDWKFQHSGWKITHSPLPPP